MPEGCTAIVEPWGGIDVSGWSRFCVENGTKTKNGKLVAWTEGKPRFKIYYKNGIKISSKDIE